MTFDDFKSALIKGNALPNAAAVAAASISLAGGTTTLSAAMLAAGRLGLIDPTHAEDYAIILLFIVGALSPLFHVLTSKSAGLPAPENAK